MNLSFQEKSIWVSLLALAAACYTFFPDALSGAASGEMDRIELLGMLVGFAVMIALYAAFQNMSGLMLTTGLLMVVALSQAADYGFQLLYYRRGF